MSATPTPSSETQAMLDSLREAVAQTLERKKRLGQYAVFWHHDAPIAVGDDAPKSLQTQDQVKK
jgi:hypothetical protein